MKKIICAMLAGAVLLLGSTVPGYALGGHAMGGHRMQSGFGGHGGFHGQSGFRGHGNFGPRVFIGPAFWWDPFYPTPFYGAPPVIVQQGSTVYDLPGTAAQQPYYWYYCQDPQGYYPYVGSCPGGWSKVTPTPPPPEKEGLAR